MKTTLQSGTLLKNISLKSLNSWRIGGNAEYLFKPKDLNDLCQFLKQTSYSKPLVWLGLGSNVLIRDAGVKGTVILTQGALKDLSVDSSHHQITAQAGLSCAQVARFAAKHNLVNGEFLAGIPGTIGGALHMNAGAFGGETWSLVEKVQTITETGDLKYYSADDFKTGYRHITAPFANEWFVSATLNLTPGEGAKSLQHIKALLTTRSETQPTGIPSCGSVFRNPKNNFAAKLIEQCGLKGTQIGGMVISLKHANFITNIGDASAEDAEQLISLIQKTVLEKTGITLTPEVHIIGEAK